LPDHHLHPAPEPVPAPAGTLAMGKMKIEKWKMENGKNEMTPTTQKIPASANATPGKGLASVQHNNTDYRW
jgi:hypothetical protein